MQHLDEGTLQALADGEVPSAELAAVRAHLEACAPCRAALDQARALVAETDDLVATLDHGFEGRAGKPGRAPIARWVRPLAWAASVVLAVGLGYAGGQSGERLPFPDSTAPAPFALDTPAAPDPPAEPQLQVVAVEEGVGAPTTQDASLPERPREPGEVRGRAASPEPTMPALAPSRDTVRSNVAQERTQPPAPGAVAGRDSAPRAPEAARRIGDVTMRLEEIVVSGTRRPIFLEVSLAEAIGRLGGTLRLIDGLVPTRLVASDSTVRVIYPAADGDIILEQVRTGETVVVTLTAPASVGADSLAVLRGRVK